MRHLAVLITCHNRKAKTIACLRRLFDQSLPPHTLLDVYLVDDGSTDGTADAVRVGYPEVHIIQSDGTLFWCDGMRLAWRHACQADPDAYFWLNDDTVLEPGALISLFATIEPLAPNPCIAVGSCYDPATREHTYGGEDLYTRHPGQLKPVAPGDPEVKSCDTFNGNCVLVNRAAFRLLGPVTSFQHAMADTDYGLRATRLGIPILLAPRYLATCRKNPIADSWTNTALPRKHRIRLVLGRKGLPPSDWWRFLWQHSGFRALLYWPRPYLRVLCGR